MYFTRTLVSSPLSPLATRELLRDDLGSRESDCAGIQLWEKPKGGGEGTSVARFSRVSLIKRDLVVISHTERRKRETLRDCLSSYSPETFFNLHRRRSVCSYLKYRIACVPIKVGLSCCLLARPRTMGHPPTLRISPGRHGSLIVLFGLI